MLVRQAISFTLNGKPVGDGSPICKAFARALLVEYGCSLGLAGLETESHDRVRDYGNWHGYSLSWEVPEELREKLSGMDLPFRWTPVAGRARPAVGNELLEDREVRVELENLGMLLGTIQWLGAA